MREIKFRAFENGQMRYDFWNRCDLGNYLNSVGVFSEVKIMQFTGLHDKNGKEIYEGDVMHLLKDPSTKPPYIWDNVNKEVVFEKGMFMVFGRTLYQASTLYQEDFSVIGNIYSNPELL